MKFEFKSAFTETEAIFIISSGKTIPSSVTNTLPTQIKSDLKSYINKDNFKGKNLEVFEFLSKFNRKNVNVFVIGTEKGKKSNEFERRLGAKIAKLSSAKKIKNITLTQASPLIIEGFLLGNYKFDNYLTSKNKKENSVKNMCFLTVEKDKSLLKEIKKTQLICEAINKVRDMVNAPPIDMTPSDLAEEAKQIGKLSGKIKVKVLNKKDIQKQKLNLLYNVGKGSIEEPNLIILEYKNKPKNKKPILLVGKGVTFDSGGLHLKLQRTIDDMKMDMAGAAVVIEVFRILANLELPLHIVGVIPAVENLVSGSSSKPNDILTAYNGKTVEITNTDAEGRLILADAISYGIKNYKPECVLDFATLTGACIVALGYTRSGMVCNNSTLRKKILLASKNSGNKIWPLPLDKIHKDKVNGEISDYKNWSGEAGAGAIMAAAFLEKFVEQTPWAHFDIAGTAFSLSENAYNPKGGSGQPLRLLFEFLENY